MSHQRSGSRQSLATRVADRHLLDRDQLLALVEDMQSLIVSMQQTVDRQGKAISELQSRAGALMPPPEPSGSNSSANTNETTNSNRKTAEPVAGSDFTIVFDGGAIGNPGKGYGSYQIVGPDGVVSEQSLNYGDNITNNQAEFMTIIKALEDLRARQGDQTPRTRLAIRGDSQLVINTITGKWKARHPGLIPLHQRAVALLREFGRTDIKWQPRSKSVAILGH